MQEENFKKYKPGDMITYFDTNEEIDYIIIDSLEEEIIKKENHTLKRGTGLTKRGFKPFKIRIFFENNNKDEITILNDSLMGFVEIINQLES